jgi:hypothetical protein
MVYAFDTLAYSKRLRDKGVSQEQAEAHAEAIREFVMADLATKADLQAFATKADLQALATKADLQALSAHVDAKLDQFDARLDQFDARLDTLSLRLTVRLGTVVVVGLGALATILKLT